MNNIDNIIDSIGLKIKYYRNLKNISLSKLAKEANISKSTLFGLEEGRSNPTISTLVNLAKSLNIDLVELIDNTKSSNNHSVNLTLLEENSRSSKTIHKLIILPNESIELDFSICKSIEIEILNGTIIDIDSKKILEQNSRTIINSNVRLKALNDGASAIIFTKPTKCNFYCKDDLFFKKPTTQLLKSLVDITKSIGITRAIFSTIYPVEFPVSIGYIKIVEATQTKETHYYIYTILEGLINGLEQLSKKIDNLNIYLEKEIQFINSLINSENISKDEFKTFNKHPLLQLQEKIINLLKKTYKDITVIDSKQELINISTTYIAVMDNFLIDIDSFLELQKKSLTVKLYRVLELLPSLKDNELTNNELKLYNLIKVELPKAYYFAKVGEYKLAIKTTQMLIDNINLKSIEGANIAFLYFELFNSLQNIANDIKSLNFLTTEKSFEKLLKELKLTILIKENFHPSPYGGKFLYILKRDK